MEQFKKDFLDQMANAAYDSHSPFNAMVACEAALESNYGRSVLAVKYKNAFGVKQHSHSVYGTVNLPTREFINGEWITVMAAWVSYPDWTACFADRLATLQRLAPRAGFEAYRDALNATDAVTYVKCVSARWSTDPDRAAKVINIYDEYMGGN